MSPPFFLLLRVARWLLPPVSPIPAVTRAALMLCRYSKSSESYSLDGVTADWRPRSRLDNDRLSLTLAVSVLAVLPQYGRFEFTLLSSEFCGRLRNPKEG